MQAYWQQQLEAQPVAFMETLTMSGMLHALADVAALVGLGCAEVAFGMSVHVFPSLHCSL